MAAQHSVYYTLLDALDLPGCPICRLALGAVHRRLDSFAYEGVNDYTIRERLRAARGFCNAHAWQLIDEIHELLGPAIVYRDVLDTLLPAVAGAAARPQALAPRARCPACAVLAEAEERYLGVFQEALPQRDFRRRYAEGFGALCRPHAAALLGRLGGHAAAEAADLVAERWAGLLAGDETRPKTQARRYRGIAGSAMALRAAGLADGQDSLLRDAALRPLELLVGRPRSDTLRSGLRTSEEDTVEAVGGGPPAQVAGGVPASPDAEDLGACAVCRHTLAAESARLARGLEPAAAGPDALLALCTAHIWRLAARGQAAQLLPAARETLAALAADLGAAPVRAGAVGAAARAWERPRAGLSMRVGDGRSAGARLAALLDSVGDCSLCLARSADEAHAADAVLAAVSDQGGLCRLHLVQTARRAVATGRRPEAEAVMRVQLARWTALRDDLLEYIRKQDYRYREEARSDEQSAPWRATAILAGEKGIRP